MVDTVATSAQLQENLINLPNCMLQVNSNIEQFNQWVRINRQSLLLRGDQVDSLMIHLFLGYDQAQDCKFRDYISDKRVSFEEGQHITPDVLMTYATIKELRDANLQLAKSLAGVKRGTANTKRKDAWPPNNNKKNVKKKVNDSIHYPLADISKDDPTYG
eukprot:13708755-Ditylum_brightwellii.AAC.1